MTRKQAPKKRAFKLLEIKKLIYTGPKIEENPVNYNLESILLLPRSSWSRGAKIAPQGAPHVLKWSPECQNGGTEPPPELQPRGAKGPAAEGVALKIISNCVRSG